MSHSTDVSAETPQDDERTQLAFAILDSEPFMWLFSGDPQHAQAHINALRDAYKRYRELGGGFNAKR